MEDKHSLSSRMSQPWFMQGCQHRRESVVVDGDDAWALFCASADGDSDRARRLIDQDPDLIHAQIWYAKPIDVALREGHVDIVQAMHEADDKRYLSTHTRDWCYRTSHEEMRRRGFKELLDYLDNYQTSLAPDYSPDLAPLKQLIERRKESSAEEQAANHEVIAEATNNPAILQKTDQRGQSLLHLALAQKNLVLITALLELGAPVHRETAQRESVLDYAVNHFPATIPLLLHHGAEPTLQTHIARGMIADMQAMLEADASGINDLDAFQTTPLTRAIRNRDVAAVDVLLKFGADPNRPCPNAPYGDSLFLATEYWHHKIMRLLLEAGANPNAELDSTGCCLSVLVDHRKWGNHPAREAYELLIEHGAVDPPEDSAEFLRTQPFETVDDGFVSHWMNSAELADIWVERFGTHRIENLWWDLGPASRPSREAMTGMMRHGLSVNKPDWWGRTLLQAEAAYGNLDRAKMLLEFGADLHATDVQARTNALGYAARGGNVEMVQFLLDQGADPSPEVPEWGQPLSYAKDFLEGHEVRYKKKAGTALRLTGHRTDQPREAYEQVIHLLEQRLV